MQGNSEGQAMQASAPAVAQEGVGARRKAIAQRDETMVQPQQVKSRVDMDSDGESVISNFLIRTGGSNVTQVSHRSIKPSSHHAKNPKSGFLDKQCTKVMFKLTWPHMSQNPRYVPEPRSFNQLSFAQFVGGECRTILKTEQAQEVTGRLKILSKIAYLYEQCKSWDRA